MFKSKLQVEEHGKKKWKLLATLVYVRDSDGDTITAPKGFVTDLASIPRGFRWLIPVNDVHRKPAVIHDHLYRIQDRARHKADKIFLEAMEDTDVPKWKHKLMYWFVSKFAGKTWRKYTKQLEKEEILAKAKQKVFTDG